jgi:hypothetical protein
MVLAALPFPPLPIVVGAASADEMKLDGETVTTTHTIIARLIMACVEKDDQAFNKEREIKQRRVLQEFLHELGCGGFDWTDPQKLFYFYCKYNYKHICTYFKETETPPQIDFLPFDYMAVGDKAHAKLVEYYNAQGILFEEEKSLDVSKKHIGEILFLLRERMGKSEDLS